jgi:hypothetical protein
VAQIRLEGIVVMVGNYGSGKTETAVNLALHSRRLGMDVRIADLDLVNPYFRTREARGILVAEGVDVVLPEARYMHADLPILTPAVAGMIRQPSELVILDAGGDDAGVTVLASLNHLLRDKTVTMLQVINPFRPFTETVEGCMRIRDEIQVSSRLTVTGLVCNANLIHATTLETLYDGYQLVKQVSERTGLDLVFATAETRFLNDLDLARFHCPILPIARKLVPPWIKPVV